VEQQQVQTQEHDHRPIKEKMTKAERRALQEAQRAAKAAKAGAQSKPSAQKPSTAVSENQNRKHGGAQMQQKVQKSVKRRERLSQPAAFFDHLPKHNVETMDDFASRALSKKIPIACVKLGKNMRDGSIQGTNTRSLMFLEMLDTVVSSFELTQGQSFTREFSLALKNMVSFLVSCRPLSPAVGNVVKSIKAELGRLATQSTLTNDEARDRLKTFIASFAQDKIIYARDMLAKDTAKDKLKDGDIVLTFSRSSSVEATFLAAAKAGKKFSVVIADSRPLLEGRELLTTLLRAGIPCEYLLLNSLETGMNQANKVVLGAAAVMSNGSLLARVGTAAVAMSACEAHVPVIVCAETYKFHERVQLDSITNNELGDPFKLLEGTGVDIETYKNNSLDLEDSKTSLLNIIYDTTPSEFVNVVMTEVGALPPTSVPVVLREYRSEAEMMNTA